MPGLDGVETTHELKKNKFIENDYHIEHVMKHKQYIAFSNSHKGLYMRELFDDRFAQMLFSGELKIIFEKWNYPYPFIDFVNEKKP